MKNDQGQLTRFGIFMHNLVAYQRSAALKRRRAEIVAKCRSAQREREERDRDQDRDRD